MPENGIYKQAWKQHEIKSHLTVKTIGSRHFLNVPVQWGSHFLKINTVSHKIRWGKQIKHKADLICSCMYHVNINFQTARVSIVYQR